MLRSIRATLVMLHECVKMSFSNILGNRVERGDVLFETLEGSFDGLYMSGSDITAGEGGVIGEISAQQGNGVQKGSVVAVIYPEGAMRVEAQIEEANLASVSVGDPVSVELLWNQDEEISYPGTISMISAIPASGASESKDGDSAVTYAVYVDFTPDANTRYGMSAVVTTLDEAEEAAEESEEMTEEPAEAPVEEPAGEPNGERGERSSERSGERSGERPADRNGEFGGFDESEREVKDDAQD